MSRESDLDFFEWLRQFFAMNPQYFSIVLILFGIFMLLAAIKNWKWIFHGDSFNTQKLEGISNMFGRGVARIFAGIGGVSCIVSGVVWFVVYMFYAKY